MLETALRETAEESLILTKDENPKIIVTPRLKIYTIDSAERLGFDLLTYEVAESVDEGTDMLEVFYEDGERIFSVKTYLDMIFDVDTSLNILQIRRLNISSNEIIPIDIEGFVKNGRYIHFNRESFLIHPSEIQSRGFCYPLENPRVFQSRLTGKKPEIYS